MQLHYRVGNEDLELTIAEQEGTLMVRVGDASFEVEHYGIGERTLAVRIAGREHRLLYCIEGSHVHVACGGHAYEFVPSEEEPAAAGRGEAHFTPEITAPMPGKVLDVLVSEGQSVDADAPLLVIEAMKMEQTVRASSAARVGAVRVEPGSMVGPGDVLILLEEPETSG